MTATFTGFIKSVADVHGSGEIEVTVCLSDPERAHQDLSFRVSATLRLQWTPGRLLHFTVYALPKVSP